MNFVTSEGFPAIGYKWVKERFQTRESGGAVEERLWVTAWLGKDLFTLVPAPARFRFGNEPPVSFDLLNPGWVLTNEVSAGVGAFLFALLPSCRTTIPCCPATLLSLNEGWYPSSVVCPAIKFAGPWVQSLWFGIRHSSRFWEIVVVRKPFLD